MAGQLKALTTLTLALQRPQSLEQMLQHIATTAAGILDTQRASLRLLDPSGAQLIAVVRAGEPLHENPLKVFELGEGLVGWVARNVAVARVPNAEVDPRFVRRPDIKEPMVSFLGVPLMSGKSCVGVLSATHPSVGHFTQEHEDLLTLLAGICAPQVEIARLSRLSKVDPLTGALNRRGLDELFPDLGGAGADVPLAVILADLDNFKDINDHFGHAVGDEALRRVTFLLSGLMRKEDSVVRYGGEEFLVILPGLEMARAIRVAERARSAVEAAPILLLDRSIRVTLSLGVAERRPGEKRDALIGRADEAMYAAKRAGRNRVEAAR